MSNTERCTFRTPRGSCFQWTAKAGEYRCLLHKALKCETKDCAKPADARCNVGECQVTFCGAHESGHKKGHE